MCRQILKQLRNFGMDTDNNLVQVREKTKQAVLWAPGTEGDVITQRDHKHKMTEFCIPSTFFSASERGIVIATSESVLNIPAQL